LERIVLVHVDEEILNPEGGIDFTKIAPFAYNQRSTGALTRRIGTHGLSKQPT